MSNWTHVIGSIYIETYRERKDIQSYVKNKLKNAPKITGSEDDVEIFVKKLNGYNLSSWKTDKNNNFLQYQTCLCVTLVGDLRDRDMETTKKEVFDFINYIEKLGFVIVYHSISIYEDWAGVKDTLDIYEDYKKTKKITKLSNGKYNKDYLYFDLDNDNELMIDKKSAIEIAYALFDSCNMLDKDIELKLLDIEEGD